MSNLKKENLIEKQKQMMKKINEKNMKQQIIFI